MGAPNLIRGRSHSGNVAATALAERNRLDILSSDYIPASLLPAVFRLTREDFGWSLPRALATVTSVPAATARARRSRPARAGACAPIWCASSWRKAGRWCARSGAPAARVM